MPTVTNPARPATPTTSREDEFTSLRGPRIRCALCGWSPKKDDTWHCHCGHNWHTFDTGGVCPGCLMAWGSTQCHACHGWSAHADWDEY